MSGTIIFDKNWLIVCEGPGDKNVLDRILSKHNIDNFCVRFPDRKNGGNAGRGGIVPWIDLVYDTVPSFRSTVKAIVIVADNDDNPGNSFNEIVAGLKKTTSIKLGIPAKEREVARNKGFPDLAVLMVPLDKVGAIEALCLPAHDSVHSTLAAVDAYLAATPAAKWGETKKSKARLQIAISGTCEAWPEMGIATMRDVCPFPVDHASFDEIVEFLKGFGSLLAEA